MSKYNIEKFKHVTVALNTPFAKDGSVDVCLRKYGRRFSSGYRGT